MLTARARMTTQGMCECSIESMLSKSRLRAAFSSSGKGWSTLSVCVCSGCVSLTKVSSDYLMTYRNAP